MTFSKQKQLFPLLIVGWVLVSCQTKQGADNDLFPKNSLSVHADSAKLLPELGLMFFKGEPFSGTLYTQYDNKQSKSETEYLNGRKHGLHLQWFANGKTSFSSEYVHGKKHGSTKSWWSNGQIRSHNQLVHGKTHGTQKYWYKSGQLFKKRNFDHGAEKGLQQSWRENGKLYNNYEARNGRIFGLKKSSLCFDLDDERIVLDE